MVLAGFIEIGDLPLVNGVLDFHRIRDRLCMIGFRHDSFMLCAALQKKFSLRLGCPTMDKSFPSHLESQAKSLLRTQRQHFVDIHKWELVLKEVITFDQQLRSYKSMLKKYKVSKFHEVNFKILHRILAMPTIIA